LCGVEETEGAGVPRSLGGYDGVVGSAGGMQAVMGTRHSHFLGLRRCGGGWRYQGPWEMRDFGEYRSLEAGVTPILGDGAGRRGKMRVHFLLASGILLLRGGRKHVIDIGCCC
jgi:hypothetical protein